MVPAARGWLCPGESWDLPGSGQRSLLSLAAAGGLKRGGCLSCLTWVMSVIAQLAANRGTASPAGKGGKEDNPKGIEQIR